MNLPSLVLAAGANAVVFSGMLDGERKGARFFTADPGRASDHYQAIDAYLSTHELDVVARFEWLDDVIHIGSLRPCVLMDWIKGSTLDVALRQRIATPELIWPLVEKWVDLGRSLHDAPLAHGDLQHGNVMIEESGTLKLVDLDGVWIPGLEGSPSGEAGHPHYQHPDRFKPRSGDEVWGADLDAFSWLVIYVSIAALAERPELWKNHHNGNNLLFSEPVFRDGNATLWRDLEQVGGDVARAASVLKNAALEPIAKLTMQAALEGPNATATTPRPSLVASDESRRWWENVQEHEWLHEHSPADESRHAPGVPAHDLQPEWETPNSTWYLESEESDDLDWVKRDRGPVIVGAGRIEAQTHTALILALLLVSGLISVFGWMLWEIPFRVVALLAVGSMVGLLARDLMARRTSPIVWDSKRLRVGAHWSADLVEVRVERTDSRALRFVDSHRSIKVRWMSERDRSRLIAALQTRSVETSDGAG